MNTEVSVQEQFLDKTQLDLSKALYAVLWKKHQYVAGQDSSNTHHHIALYATQSDAQNHTNTVFEEIISKSFCHVGDNFLYPDGFEYPASSINQYYIYEVFMPENQFIFSSLPKILSFKAVDILESNLREKILKEIEIDLNRNIEVTLEERRPEDCHVDPFSIF